MEPASGLDFFAGIATRDEPCYAFDRNENADPEKAYFSGMSYRVMRAVEFAKTLPGWNGRDLVVEGGSQGGLQAVWAAALCADVTEARADAPWCCDLAKGELGRFMGDTDQPGGRAPWFVPYVSALRYYDPVNHARRVPATVAFTIPRAGLGDYVCPPSGVAVLWNNLACPKQITWLQSATHGVSPHEKEPQQVTWEAPAVGLRSCLGAEPPVKPTLHALDLNAVLRKDSPDVEAQVRAATNTTLLGYTVWGNDDRVGVEYDQIDAFLRGHPKPLVAFREPARHPGRRPGVADRELLVPRDGRLQGDVVPASRGACAEASLPAAPRHARYRGDVFRVRRADKGSHGGLEEFRPLRGGVRAAERSRRARLRLSGQGTRAGGQIRWSRCLWL